MTQYRKDIEKLYNRIIKIVGRGQSYLQNYYDLLDEVIESGNSDLLQDVMLTKFKIDTRKFSSIDQVKKNTFKSISFFLESKSNQNLQDLFNSRGVYALGTQFFDAFTNQYLGDIKEYNTQTVSRILDIYTFYPQYLKTGVPKFNSNPQNTLVYKNDSIVYYGDKLFLCVKDYTWDRNNRITPTFSEYWTEIYAGTTSFHTISDQSSTVIDRYASSIDILRRYNYIDYSNNNYIKSNYIDEYFE